MRELGMRVRKAVHRVVCDRRGFTLIEMLIVIAIIGILAAIAVPSFSKVTQAAKKKACEANVQTLERLIDLYRVDNGKDPDSVEQLAGYLETGELPKCPVTGDEGATAYVFDEDDEGNVTGVHCASCGAGE